jgi:microcystin-dependent protein
VADPYIGEIRMFGGNYAPAGWAFCDGTLMPIAENDALFVLIGTTYGGDGQETFALPDLRGRAPLHMGTNPSGGVNHQLGEAAGVEETTLTALQIPSHSHPLVGSSLSGLTRTPIARAPARTRAGRPVYATLANPVEMATPTSVGGSQAHENMQPFLAINFIIALAGIFPPQN